MKSLITLVFIGCKQEERPLLPTSQRILGKWETFYVGNGEYRPPIMNPSGYQEFRVVFGRIISLESIRKAN